MGKEKTPRFGMAAEAQFAGKEIAEFHKGRIGRPGLGAEAYTAGGGLFGDGPSGQKLVGHELTHTVQQGGGKGKHGPDAQDNGAEQGASQAGKRFAGSLAERMQQRFGGGFGGR